MYFYKNKDEKIKYRLECIKAAIEANKGRSVGMHQLILEAKYIETYITGTFPTVGVAPPPLKKKRH